jgi:hypothetical protein
MFERHDLSPAVEAVRADHAPEAVVLDAGRDFETLDPATAENLGLFVDSLDPETFPADWVPADAPRLLHRYAADGFTVGLPGDGSVAWTRQTDPPIVLVKPRVKGSPEAFVDFLVAEAIVEISLDLPESSLSFFGDAYSDLYEAVTLDANATYQVGAALYDGYKGLSTRETFAGWAATENGDDGESETENGDDPTAPLGVAYRDAGDRIEPRLSDLHAEVVRGEIDFADATELACAALKHDVDLPAPFSALSMAAYRERGAPYAVVWADRVFDSLDEV